MSGFSITASNFTIEDKEALRRVLVNVPVSMPLFTIINGIKYAEKVPYMDSDAEFQADSTCATINASGTTTVAQITLTVDNVKIEDSWCLKTLEGYFTQKYLRKGSKLDEGTATAFMNEVIAQKMDNAAYNMEAAIWQSSKTSGLYSTNFKQFNGFLQTIDTLGTCVNSQTAQGTSYTSITSANVVTIFQNQWKSVPSKVKRKLSTITVCGDDVFDTLVLALVALNQYNYVADDASGKRELTLPGTNMRIKAVPGLNNDNHASLHTAAKQRIVTFHKENLFVGTDEINDTEDTMTWYEKKDDLFYFRNRFKITTGIMFPTLVVHYKNV
jgi:hypothetical protein